MNLKVPTVVLVHGAFADSSSWAGVVADLRRRAIPVVAVANPLRGLRSDAAYVAEVANSVAGPVVLAGHSYGGMVISRAGSEVPRARALVYVAAFLPDRHESGFVLSGQFPGSMLGPETTHALGTGGGVELTIKADHFREVFAADLPIELAATMAVVQRPVAERALADELDVAPAWARLPSWAVIATQDNGIPPAAQEFMAQRAAAECRHLAASHAVAVSQPGAVTEVIVRAITETL